MQAASNNLAGLLSEIQKLIGSVESKVESRLESKLSSRINGVESKLQALKTSIKEKAKVQLNPSIPDPRVTEIRQ